MKKIAMIPAKLGSERLFNKNLREFCGAPLIVRAVENCKKSGVFDEIWINSEAPIFKKIAKEQGVNFHKRSKNLSDNSKTHEHYIADFLKKVECPLLFQIQCHSPFLKPQEIVEFVKYMEKNDFDTLLSVVKEQHECFFKGEPVNFNLNRKESSQNLEPVYKVVWSITGWKGNKFLESKNLEAGKSFAGKIGHFVLDWKSGFAIKTEEDLMLAEAIFKNLG